jgi:hypothetical protein
MTVAETVKDAVGLGGGGTLPMVKNIYGSSDNAQNQLGQPEKRCRKQSYHWRTEIAVRIFSFL